MSSVDIKAVTADSNPIIINPSDQLVLVEISDQLSESKYQFLSESDLIDLSGAYRVICRADINTGSLFSDTSEQLEVDLPDVGATAFMNGMTAALNLVDPFSIEQTPQETLVDEAESAEKTSVANRAVDAATDAFFETMEQNIDRWTYDASSSMLGSLAMRGSEDVVMLRREAADIQMKSAFLNSEFRAFFIESLVNFKCEEPIASQTESRLMELAGSDAWKAADMEPLLLREYAGNTRVEFTQLCKGLCRLLGREIHADENILGPKSIAYTLSQSLDACGFSTNQQAVLNPILIGDFNASLEKLYKQINNIWIDLGVMPKTNLEVLSVDAA